MAFDSFLEGSLVGLLLFTALNGLLLFTKFLSPALKKKLPTLIKPRQIKKSKREELELKYSDLNAKSESCSWLNCLLTRLWYEYTEKESIQKFLHGKVEEELVDVKRTMAGVLLKSWEVNDAWVGKCPPSFSNISVVSKQTSETDFTMLLDILVKDLAFIFTATTPLDAVISVKVSISSLRGRMAFMYSPSHMHTISFCFTETPKLDMVVEAAVLQDKNTWVSRIASKLIVFAVHTVIKQKLTLPAMKTKWFLNKPEQPPYPWQVDDPQKLYDWKPKPKGADGEPIPTEPLSPSLSNASSLAPMTTSPTSPSDTAPLQTMHTAPAALQTTSFQRSESPSPVPAQFSEKKGSIYPRRHTSGEVEERMKSKDSREFRDSSRDSSKKSSLTQAKAVAVRKENHNWKVWTFTSPTNCGICQQALWGSARQGSRCVDCGFNVHEKCRGQTMVCPVSSVQSNVLNGRQSNPPSEGDTPVAHSVAQPKDEAEAEVTPRHPQAAPQGEESDEDAFADAREK